MRTAAESDAFSIKEAGANDADLVAILVNRLFRELHDWRPPISEEEIHRIFIDLLSDDGRFTAFLAFDPSNRPIAVMTVAEAVSVYAHGRFGVIMELYVTPTERSAGVGDALIAEAKSLAAERGWGCLEMTTPRSSSLGRISEFCARSGFSPVGAVYRCGPRNVGVRVTESEQR